MSETELWLTRRAAAGDQRAFEVLLERCAPKLRNIVSNFTNELDADEGYSIMVERVWSSILKGAYNPNRAPFVSYASMLAHQVLREDRRARHLPMRWPDKPPTSVDALVDEQGWEVPSPSWSLGADPLNIVLWRERLTESVQALSAARLAAVNFYFTGGRGASQAQIRAMCRAREQTAALRLV